MAKPTADMPTAHFLDYNALCREHYDRAGLGADAMEKLFR